MANKRFYADLRSKAKRANQRMLRLEREGITSAAYQAAQAKLEVLGRQASGDKGRRFSESGKATYNEMRLQSMILDEFLNAVTSTVSGTKQYYEDVWETSNEEYDLDEAGITKEEWLDFWDNMPDRKERLYGSDQIIAIIRAYEIKNGDLKDKDKMTMEEIANEIQSSRSLKAAYKNLGLSSKEVLNARPLQ